MIALNENNKNGSILKFFLTKLNKALRKFIKIIFLLLILLFLGVVLGSLFITLYFCIDFIFPPVAYIFHSCLIGFIIGCTISYGFGENKYSNKKILFIIILLCSISAFLLYGFQLIDLTPIICKIVFHRSINILFLCLTCLGIGGYFSKNKYINLAPTGIVLLLYIIISIVYKSPTKLHNLESGIKLQQLYILYFCFFTPIIIKFISYKLEHKKYLNKKTLFIWILLFSIIAYLSFNVIYYILAPEQNGIEGYWNFLFEQLENNCRPQIGYSYPPSGFWETMPMEYKILSYVIRFYKTITFGKITSYYLIIIISIQICIAEFLITVFCAWKFLILSGTYLSVIDPSERYKKNPDYKPENPIQKEE